MSVSTLLNAAGGTGKGDAFRYWRFFFLNNYANNSWMELCAAYLYTSVGGANVTTPTMPIAATSQFNSTSGAVKNLIDDQGESTRWLSAANNGTNQEVVIDLGTPRKIVEVGLLRSVIDPTYTPKDFTVSGSHDWVTWTLIKEFPQVPPVPVALRRYQLY